MGGAESGWPGISIYDDDTFVFNFGSTGSNSGRSVAIDGDWAVVGIPGYGDGGAIYILKRSGNSWTYVTLIVGTAVDNNSFGHAVDISGDNIIVGAPLNDEYGTDSGRAYWYHFNGTYWELESKEFGNEEWEYGYDVAIDGNYTVSRSSRLFIER